MSRVFRILLFSFLVLLAITAFTGCEKTILTDPLDGRGGSTGKTQPRSGLEEAQAALASGDYKKAEYLAQRESGRQGISQSELAQVSRVYAIAALRNKHPNVTLTALEQWQIAQPGADETREWQDIWCESMGQISPWSAKTRAEALYQDAGRSAQARSTAGIFLTVKQWEEGRLGETLAVLENLYASAADKKLRAMLEQRLALQLHAANTTAVSLVAGAVTPENQGSYPYSIILVDQLRRQTMNASTRDEALAALSRLSKEITLADPSLFKGLPASAIATPVSSGPISGKPVVLALPLSGAMGNMSAKIVAGAEAACRDFAASGVQVSLVIIDTDQPDWIARVDGLPAEATIIGGPLHPSALGTARSQGLTSRRALFTFMPALEQGEEGTAAWRFFPSADDQIDALLRFTGSLGISGYAVFYPEEGYGNRMSSLFSSKAHSMGAGVHTAAYAPNNPATWLRSVGELLAANKNPEHARGSTFQAIFLPDTWKNMDIIVPNIFYYNETRQVLMGAALWEQGIAAGGFVSPQYYGLAIFPGAWNPGRMSPAAERLQSGLLSAGRGPADFWTGLGYDFTRLSTSLNVGPGWTPGKINASLQSQNMDWSMAPIHWDAAGRARQEMFLFQPVEGGFAPLDEAEFRKTFSSAWK